jgi:2-polyprenyl-3-methyl-5-hydroxy-6-metoxy-1,4-benzoquinol methylase
MAVSPNDDVAPRDITNAEEDLTDPGRYPLGRSDHEARRLMLQHRIYGPSLRQLLGSAGVTSGMRVLDVGSGAGDVTLLLADIVGPDGEVVGVEFAPESIELAMTRTAAAGVGSRVRFVQADLRDFAAHNFGPGEYDAVVGRFVLMYQPDPTDLLRRLAQVVRPGGMVVFQESDLIDVAMPYPPAALHEQVWRWLSQPDGVVVAQMRMGPKLFGTYVDAGLPAPNVRIDTPVGGGAAWLGYEFVAESVRSMLPILTALGIVDADEVDVDTLADRLRDDIVASNGVQPLPSVYGAWAIVA